MSLEIIENISDFINFKVLNSQKIILMVDGGFGSQLNKYFIGQWLEKNLKAKVEYDLSWFENHAISIDGKDTRNFDLLKVFPDIKFPIASKKDIKLYKKNFLYTNPKPCVYNESLLKKKPPLYVDGYLTHWKYLKDIDLKCLEMKLTLDDINTKNLENINKSNCSVAVHVRRGDYVNSIHDVLTPNYFINAIKYLQNKLSEEKPTFFIFSTDIDWVNTQILSELPQEINYQILNNNNNTNGIYDFYLISQCHHQICANSSFSYYAAFLNKNIDKKVIIPELWINSENSIFENHNNFLRYPRFTVMSDDGNIIKD